MADERILIWIDALLARELRNFERARKRFVRSPHDERLHALRTMTRRLRGLLDDVDSVAVVDSLKRDLRKLLEATGEVRDATVMRTILRSGLDTNERDAARPVLQQLRIVERRARRAARKRARRISVRFS